MTHLSSTHLLSISLLSCYKTLSSLRTASSWNPELGNSTVTSALHFLLHLHPTHLQSYQSIGLQSSCVVAWSSWLRHFSLNTTLFLWHAGTASQQILSLAPTPPSVFFGPWALRRSHNTWIGSQGASMNFISNLNWVHNTTWNNWSFLDGSQYNLPRSETCRTG